MRSNKDTSTTGSSSNPAAQRSANTQQNYRMFMQNSSLAQYRANDCTPTQQSRLATQAAAIEPASELDKDVLNFLM